MFSLTFAIVVRCVCAGARLAGWEMEGFERERPEIGNLKALIAPRNSMGSREMHIMLN